MITKNFKNLMKVLLQSASSSVTTGGMLPVRTWSASDRYVGTKFSNSVFPYIVVKSVSFTNTDDNGGIRVGSGNTPPTENDYKLETPITSGLSASTPSISYGADANGNPYMEYIFLLTNSSANDIVVREIGYVQPLYSTTGLNSTAGSGAFKYFLLDRTVLETPVTVSANGGSAAIRYILKTNVS